jgi:preprotein translocase subunit SecF
MEEEHTEKSTEEPKEPIQESPEKPIEETKVEERKEQTEEHVEERKEPVEVSETQSVSDDAQKASLSDKHKPEPKPEPKVEHTYEHKVEHKVHHHKEHRERKKFNLKEIYDKEYKKLLIIPFVLLFLAIFSIVLKVATTGDFINRDVSLKGGLTLTIPYSYEVDIISLENYIASQFPENDISVRALRQTGMFSGIVIDADIEKESLGKLVSSVEENMDFTLDEEMYSVEVMGSSLGASFFRETITAVLIAFLFMGFVVFFYFKVPAPSLAVILAAFSDIVVTLAIVNMMGMKLSTAGIAAFLMLIGYSVDTDILLSTKVLKRKDGTVMERIMNAMKTGLMMNATTVSAIIVALIFTQSEVIKQIMTILLIGLLVDLINTWIQNVGILRLYLEKKHKNV